MISGANSSKIIITPIQQTLHSEAANNNNSNLKTFKNKNIDAYVRGDNANPKDIKIKNLISKTSTTEHFLHVHDHKRIEKTALNPIPLNNNKLDMKAVSDIQKTALGEFAAAQYKIGNRNLDRLEPVKLAGVNIPKNTVHVALHKDAHRDAVAMLGQELKKINITADDMPTFYPLGFYGSLEDAYVANTHGLRVEDIQKMDIEAAQQIANWQRDFPDCKFVFSANALDTWILPNHPTMGGLANPEREKANQRGQALHVQTQLSIVTADDKKHDLFTAESTGAANHPTGENSDDWSFSFNGDHFGAPTDPLPVRTTSKDGQRDLSQLTPYMKTLQGQNTNFFNVQRGSHTQEPEGLEFEKNFSIQTEVEGGALLKTVSRFLLAEKGGQVIYDDERVENPNKKFSEDYKNFKAYPEVRHVLTAGTFGQHGQGGGLLMCASTALEQMFGKEGVLANANFNKPNTTNDVMFSLLQHAMDSGDAEILDGNGNVVPQDKYDDFLNEKPAFKAESSYDEEYERKENLEGMELGHIEPQTIHEYVHADDHRVLKNRYNEQQQIKDFGDFINTPPAPEETMAWICDVLEAQTIYDLDDKAVANVLQATPYRMDEFANSDATAVWLEKLPSNLVDLLGANEGPGFEQ